MKKHAIIIATLIALLPSCARSQPTLEDAQQAIVNYFKDRDKKTLKVTVFRIGEPGRGEIGTLGNQNFWPVEFQADEAMGPISISKRGTAKLCSKKLGGWQAGEVTLFPAPR